jgi:hypothetical protein
VSACRVHLTGRKDDCCSVKSTQLLRETDAGSRNLEIDVYERNIRPPLARQFQSFA